MSAATISAVAPAEHCRGRRAVIVAPRIPAPPAGHALLDLTIPEPGPILTKIGHTPMVELWDGGGGLPYLGSSTSYNAGDWENTLRAYVTSKVYVKQIAKVDAVAERWTSRAGRGRFKLERRHGHFRGVKVVRASRKGHDRGHAKAKPAIVFDVDETALSNYSAIDKDDFTFGPNSQAEATNEIGEAIVDEGYRILAGVGDQYSDLAGGHEAVAFKLPNPFYFLP
jgi:hypothetical protein